MGHGLASEAMAAPEVFDPAFGQSAYFVDSDHEAIRTWSHEVTAGAGDDRERAVALYYRVRDDIRYDPYALAVDRDDLKASAVLSGDRNWCIPKAVLLCAGSRAVGVACRLGFADVRNHLASEKLLEQMGTDVFAFHGYVEFRLEDRWVKATPAFNLEMCTRFGVKPLEFDGSEDSLYHAFDVEGRRHMEYIRQRGTFADLPFDTINATFAEIYGPEVTLVGAAAGSTPPEARYDEAFHGPCDDQP